MGPKARLGGLYVLISVGGSEFQSEISVRFGRHPELAKDPARSVSKTLAMTMPLHAGSFGTKVPQDDAVHTRWTATRSLSLKRRWATISLFSVCLLLLPQVGSAQTNPAPPAGGQLPSSVQTAPNPDFAEAERLLQQGKYDDAVSQLSDLAAKKPDLKGLSSELGTAYYQKGDYIKAVESFKKALVEDPENKEAVQLLGLSYYLSGRPAEAIPLPGKGARLVSAGQRGCFLYFGFVLHPDKRLSAGAKVLRPYVRGSA